MYRYGSPPPPITLLPLLARSVAYLGQLLSPSFLCNISVKQSVAPTTPRYRLQLVYATLGHNPVSTPNSKWSFPKTLSWLEKSSGRLLGFGLSSVWLG